MCVRKWSDRCDKCDNSNKSVNGRFDGGPNVGHKVVTENKISIEGKISSTV
jgi:hypothetical protein